MPVLSGVEVPAETVAAAETLTEAISKAHAATKAAAEAQEALETALRPYTVSQIDECRDVRKLGRQLTGIVGHLGFAADDARHIAGVLGKAAR